MGRGWLVAFGFATAAVFVGWYGPLQVLLARQAEGVGGAGKEGVLALVAAVGAVGSMVANPVWGALSDRSGRRLPWVLGGAVAGAGGLVLLGTATTTVGVVAGWVGVQVALNAPFAALSAVIPDQVPENRRGTVGGWFGLAQTVGIMAGTGLALVGGTVLSGYLTCAAAVAIGVVPFMILAKEEVPSRQSTKAEKTPDFRWAWVTRFLINLGNAIALLYLLHYLKDEVRVADPDGGVFLLTAVYAVALLSTVVAGGALSDRVGRRRVFVCAAGLIMAAAAVLLAAWSTWTGAITAAVVLGVGFGAYTSVDFALVTEVLPTAADRGKDLGVINVANTLPQVLAPVVAAPLVALGGYPVLYMVAAVVGVAGSVLVFRIKTVR
ncbi:MFS transporter [Actinokineospora cianjurensis]|uniref:MFS transporter n=1 Tax=Actinokineospora cianjurensis TaxID=585224 RepID=A0A421B4F3_9PSEU|nr:MFS transporter [Actinokineospora cianjurensis]RLK59205.1 MFS transporter [Actinokineospora cianjurensis]